MQLINGSLKLHMRNEEGALEVYTLTSLADLDHPRFADMDPNMKFQASQLLRSLEQSPTYGADLAAAGAEFERTMQERRANKRSLVIESTPQRQG